MNNIIKIKFVLVETSHPGNLGASARAIANMGFNQIVLVQPKADHMDPVAVARAANAKEVLENIIVTDNIQDAIADCSLVLGTVGKDFAIPWTRCTPRKAAEDIVSLDCNANIAIIFGPESSGLTNEILQLCSAHILIPTGPYTSLNLAQAIQIISYELHLATLGEEASNSSSFSTSEDPATSSQSNDFFKHLESVMIKTHFLEPSKPKKLISRLMSLFQRANMSANEVQMLRGFLSSIERNINNGI